VSLVELNNNADLIVSRLLGKLMKVLVFARMQMRREFERTLKHEPTKGYCKRVEVCLPIMQTSATTGSIAMPWRALHG
jgi:hypothetical protein